MKLEHERLRFLFASFLRLPVFVPLGAVKVAPDTYQGERIMGTVKCPNHICGKEISDRFNNCPFCNTPLTNVKSIKSDDSTRSEESDYQENTNYDDGLSIGWTLVYWIIAFFTVLFCVTIFTILGDGLGFGGYFIKIIGFGIGVSLLKPIKKFLTKKVGKNNID